MKDGRHIIWSNDIDYDDWREDLEEQYPDLTEAERMDLMYELNGDYLDDERSNLDIQLSRPILVVGDLGLWHGRRMGYKEIPSGNIRDCLYSERDMDYSTWYVDKNGDFRCDAMLNQAFSDRAKLSKLLNISDEQMSYVTNADAGCGLIKYGSALVPFINRFPKDTELYRLMTTRPGEGVFGSGNAS